jgi:phage FluMu protein Com
MTCPGCKENLFTNERLDKRSLFNHECFNFPKEYWERDCPKCGTNIRMFKMKAEHLVGMI